jgi:hypothetical protein
VGARILQAHGGKISDDTISIPGQKIVAGPAELFSIGDLMKFCNPDWRLDRAAYSGLHGATYLDGDVLLTYPHDDFRGLVFRRSTKLSGHLEVATDPGRAWQCEVYANNQQMLTPVMDGGSLAALPPQTPSDSDDHRLFLGGKAPREWRRVDVDLGAYAGQSLELPIFQRLIYERMAGSKPVPQVGSAYWKSIRLD